MGTSGVRAHHARRLGADAQRLRDGGEDRPPHPGKRVSLEAEMLGHIKAGVEHHNATCPMPARAILLNAGNYELFGWDEVFGLPVEPRDDIPPKRFRVDCPGSAY